MPLLSFLAAVAQAFANLPGQIVIWLHDTLIQAVTAFVAVPAPVLVVIAIVAFLVALAAVRTVTR